MQISRDIHRYRPLVPRGIVHLTRHAQFSPPRCTPPRLGHSVKVRIQRTAFGDPHPPVAKTLIPANAANISVELQVVPPSLFNAIAAPMSRLDIFVGLAVRLANRSSS